MANPLSGLTPALEVLAKNVDILPATGQAVEDLMRPDQEEVEDEILNGDAWQFFCLITLDFALRSPGTAERSPPDHVG